MKKLIAQDPNGRLPLTADRPLGLLTRFFLHATEPFVHELVRVFTGIHRRSSECREKCGSGRWSPCSTAASEARSRWSRRKNCPREIPGVRTARARKAQPQRLRCREREVCRPADPFGYRLARIVRSGSPARRRALWPQRYISMAGKAQQVLLFCCRMRVNPSELRVEFFRAKRGAISRQSREQRIRDITHPRGLSPNPFPGGGGDVRMSLECLGHGGYMQAKRIRDRL
jgi:hypothetical protein